MNELTVMEDLPTLPFIITAKSGKVSEGNMFSAKDVEKLLNNIVYKTNIANKYSNIASITPDIIVDIVLMIINGTYSYVSYRRQDYTGKPIPIYKDNIVKEIISFIMES